MRVFLGLLAVSVLSFTLHSAETAGEDPQITRAKDHLAQIQKLADIGAIARVQVAQAQEDLADAEDAAVLHHTLYGQDLSDAQSEEMIAAAQRRYERRQQAFDKAKKLVDQGVATQASLSAAVDDLDLARKECALAEQRADLVRQVTAMAHAEVSLEQRLATAPATVPELGQRFDGDGRFNPQIFARVEAAFEHRFGKPLPVSAMGETAVHRALGFDHRGRVDVAIQPEQPEGVWLRQYLTANNIPFFAFRHAVPGKATGAHIHLGPQSTRLVAHGG